ncbi:DUF6879 family protein [Streptomyces caatingaensis]|uniref:DUF6879 domain-containing protein n=1 Tax=Streptomyces caatingaensis TaxID=1678637 RepID=A0A0K9XFR0_9ACTN|nr:DUF6879 family protein [Streptomyces caatingaensis]KNB51512.1 hypothetical protein AC230_14090 [Streptomyces caatingaensis]
MTSFIRDEDFDHYFDQGFRHSAWRFETRRGYASDAEGEEFRRFLRGEDPAEDPHRPWCRAVRELTGQGKRIRRVRLFDEPPTVGQRYLLAIAWTNVEAGEDIRGLPRHRAEELGLPMVDFWLFDSRFALRLHFDAQDQYLGAELVEDEATILTYCRVHDTAWQNALEYKEFKARVPSTV